MDVDDFSQGSIRSTDWAVEVDYSVLDDDERDDNSAQLEKRYQDDIKRRNEEIDKMAPNLKAIDRLEGVEQRLGDMEEEYRTARRTVESAKEKFDQVRHKRNSLFQRAFTHISEHIDQVYKELTRTPTFPLGGSAYLTLEDTDEPYLKGVLYHAMPPMKRFRDMNQLSGGEKSMAALALLFAIRR
ncbi:P-loop containing nucleoside triphosphate hydrolase protein [Absidia repens]|uniref:p-loop containing nucleoside triphosphate hydrolase protein n=1 Tax=Absidia repens TaxID=90262 RepID=A0A1X2I6L7_9FUNG|nr:P-loop containing nucleoside triphosphate hydrolase protein [Absidia repens]